MRAVAGCSAHARECPRRTFESSRNCQKAISGVEVLVTGCKSVTVLAQLRRSRSGTLRDVVEEPLGLPACVHSARRRVLRSTLRISVSSSRLATEFMVTQADGVSMKRDLSTKAFHVIKGRVFHFVRS